MDRKHTCCFTGHRNLPKEDLEKISLKLFYLVRGLINEGYVNFVTGGALGFDTLAALTVLSLKRDHPMITLNVISPYLGQTDSFTESQKAVFNDIKSLADDFSVLRIGYQKGCMQERNRAMVDLSSLCVAYMDKEASGTGYTVRYALKNNLKVINMCGKK